MNPDLIGQRFGRLVVVETSASKRGHHRRWLCRCDCGNERIVQESNLTSGHSRSCGRLRTEVVRVVNVTHGHTIGRRIPSEFTIWAGMLDRCRNPRAEHFAHYGGRGIAVCERWREDFAAFYADMGQRPSVKHSIGRINNDGPYSPDNCRWETRAQQALNQRSNRLETFMGETKPLVEWARCVGLPYKTVHARLNRGGWSLERALTEPLRDWSSLRRRKAA